MNIEVPAAPSDIHGRARRLMLRFESQGYRVRWFILGFLDWQDVLIYGQRYKFGEVEMGGDGVPPMPYGVHVATCNVPRWLECVLEVPGLPDGKE